MSTVAGIVGHEATEYNGKDVGEDSWDVMPSWTGSDTFERPPVVMHSINGVFAIRSGKWKLIESLGSGGFTAPARI